MNGVTQHLESVVRTCQQRRLLLADIRQVYPSGISNPGKGSLRAMTTRDDAWDTGTSTDHGHVIFGPTPNKQTSPLLLLASLPFDPW